MSTARHGRVRRVAGAGQHVLGRDGFDPRVLGQDGGEAFLDRIDRGAEAHGPLPLGPAGTQLVEAHVGGDPVQPGAQRGTALEPLVGPPRAQEGLLDRVIGVEGAAQQSVAVSGELAAVDLQLRGELVRGQGLAGALHGF
jgi:hypothetical protein